MTPKLRYPIYQKYLCIVDYIGLMHTTMHNIEDFWVIGINYKKSDASVRGLFAVTTDQYDNALSTARSFGVTEFFILSTCNRTEIYGLSQGEKPLADLLSSVCTGDKKTFEEISYKKSGRSAIEHTFQVAAGLDSQILGDYEILGQMKNAVKYAKVGGFIGTFMERLINSVLQASKAIKTHTALSGGTVSVSFAAVQYIREYFEGPASTPKLKCPSSAHMMTDPSPKGVTMRTDDKKIVLIGAGKIGRSTCKNLVDYLDTRDITLVNRTEEKAKELAQELNLKFAPITDLDNEVSAADVVVVSTSAKQPLILKRHLEGKGKKLLIDISVPSNVDAEAQRLPGVTFVDVDMLSKIKDETLQQRRTEIPKAITIIAEHIDEFMEWYEMRKHAPALKELKNKLKRIYIEPTLLSHDAAIDMDEKIQKVVNNVAAKIKKVNTPGCHYIQAINDYIA